MRRLGAASLDRLIAFVCVAASHRTDGGVARDHLTVHRGAWAFCALNAQAPDHVWERAAPQVRGTALPGETDASVQPAVALTSAVAVADLQLDDPER